MTKSVLRKGNIRCCFCFVCVFVFCVAGVASVFAVYEASHLGWFVAKSRQPGGLETPFVLNLSYPTWGRISPPPTPFPGSRPSRKSTVRAIVFEHFSALGQTRIELYWFGVVCIDLVAFIFDIDFEWIVDGFEVQFRLFWMICDIVGIIWAPFFFEYRFSIDFLNRLLMIF